MLWVPEEFAHGLIMPLDEAEFLYKTTGYYAPQYERSIRCNDPDIGIDWQLTGQPMLSTKDQTGVLLRDTEFFS